MLTMTRPLPATPYTGPIRTPSRPLPITPPMPSPPMRTASASVTPKSILKRRSHTRRLQSAPSPDLPPVTEEEETENVDEPIAPPKLKKRPRPTPLIPSRTYAPSALPLIVEIPDNAGTFDRPMKKDEYDGFALSPSTLFARRRSETILDFPVPPSHALPIPTTSSSPVAPADNSPTPSNVSLTSTSSASSSAYPLTPHPSEDEDDMQSHPEKLEIDTDIWAEVRSPRRPYRSSSVISLRSFSMAEFDAQAEDIYALLHPQREAAAQSPVAPREETAAVLTAQSIGPSPRLVLSVLDTAHGGSFNVPLMLGSFLSPPSSPATSDSPMMDSDSDCDGIPLSWSDSEGDDFGSGLSSSEDDASDGETGPRRYLDPAFHTSKLERHRHSRHGSRSPILPPLPMLEPLDMGPDTPSVYSMASPVDWTNERLPPRESLIPSDVPHESYPPPTAPLPRPPSPSCPSRVDSPSPMLRSPSPMLRSRFSTSTLGSLPPQPTSTTQAFFARLTSRVKPSSPSKGERSPVSRTSPRRRHIVPPSPAPSAFSFSTHSASSRSSLDSGDSSSVFSEDSASSSGLRRPPIPIELFLRG